MNESIKALVGQLSYDVEDETGAMVMVSRQAILAAITALKSIAEGTHDETVERVARAIWNVDAHPGRRSWEEALDSEEYAEALDDCRNYARAAIAATNEVR